MAAVAVAGWERGGVGGGWGGRGVGLGVVVRWWWRCCCRNKRRVLPLLRGRVESMVQKADATNACDESRHDSSDKSEEQ